MKLGENRAYTGERSLTSDTMKLGNMNPVIPHGDWTRCLASNHGLRKLYGTGINKQVQNGNTSQKYLKVIPPDLGGRRLGLEIVIPPQQAHRDMAGSPGRGRNCPSGKEYNNAEAE
eukprot:CAMPEP_0172519238 /NCGR_PEP_ID=MMETSP1066-20121228/291296_1 /TAXON_ID=671091 /ORGANISM="Coscinodiscus wailesii, Strain CCMP2513" /LENGTH=115 /DNA_ID=CAMNT_0013301787 /DNA_START=2048 /DNA_END=2395 /DNA_ORIENTATION=+